MRRLTNPSEGMGNVAKARLYREHGTPIRDLLDEQSLGRLRKAKKR